MRLALLTLAVLLVLGGAFYLLHHGDAGPAAPELAPLGGYADADAPVALDDAQLQPASPSVHALAPVREVGLATLSAAEVIAAALAPGARVSGRLLDESGAPIAGEQVDLFIAGDRWEPLAEWPPPDDEPGAEPLSRTRSNVDGRFELAARPGAVHALRAGGRRHPRTTVVDVHAGDALTVTLEPPRTLTGFVLAADSGLPLAGAFVSARGEHTHLLGTTDDAGRFALAPLPAEALGVAAWTPGHEIAVLPEQVPEFDEPVLELVPGRAVPGQVVDRGSDEPIAGAEVRVVLDTDARLLADSDPLQKALVAQELVVLSDETGAFVVEDCPSWGFRVEATAEGYLPDSIERHRLKPLRPDGEVIVRLSPERPLLVDVRADGAPAAGASVWVRDQGGAEVASAVADETGAASLELARWDGAQRLWVFGRDGAGRIGREGIGKRIGEEPVTLELVEPLPLVVRVERDEVSVPGAQVAVLVGKHLPWLASTGADGEARFELPVARDGGDTVVALARAGSDVSLPGKLELDGVEPLTDEPLVLAVDGGAWVAGQVVDTWGQPVPGARVASHGHADDEGRFRLGPFDDERSRRFKVFADGFRGGSFEVLPPADDVLVVLEPVVSWEGRVVDAASGLPAERFEGLLERELFDDQGARWRPTKSKLQRALVPGEFTVDLPEAGRYRVRVLVRDHLPALSDVVDFDGVNAPPFADVISSPAAVLEVLVLDSVGAPVPGVELTLAPWELNRDRERPSGRSTRGAPRRRTGDDGRARFDLGEGGSYRLGTRRDWLMPGRLDVLPGAPYEQVVRVGATGSLLVRVLGETGEPLVAKVGVKSLDSPLAVRRTVRTDPARHPEGARLEQLPPGRYSLSASARDHHAPPREVVVAPARTFHVDVLMLPGRAPPKPKDKPNAKKSGVSDKKAAKQAAKGRDR